MRIVRDKRRYETWAGDEKGVPEDAACCIEAVFPHGGYHNYQCERKRGYGKDGLYCKRHAKTKAKDSAAG